MSHERISEDTGKYKLSEMRDLRKERNLKCIQILKELKPKTILWILIFNSSPSGTCISGMPGIFVSKWCVWFVVGETQTWDSRDGDKAMSFVRFLIFQKSVG